MQLLLGLKYLVHHSTFSFFEKYPIDKAVVFLFLHILRLNMICLSLSARMQTQLSYILDICDLEFICLCH